MVYDCSVFYHYNAKFINEIIYASIFIYMKTQVGGKISHVYVFENINII